MAGGVLAGVVSEAVFVLSFAAFSLAASQLAVTGRQHGLIQPVTLMAATGAWCSVVLVSPDCWLTTAARSFGEHFLLLCVVASNAVVVSSRCEPASETVADSEMGTIQSPQLDEVVLG